MTNLEYFNNLYGENKTSNEKAIDAVASKAKEDLEVYGELRTDFIRYYKEIKKWYESEVNWDIKRDFDGVKKTYRFELEAYHEVDVIADSLGEAYIKADKIWEDTFGDTGTFGMAQLKEEVEE